MKNKLFSFLICLSFSVMSSLVIGASIDSETMTAQQLNDACMKEGRDYGVKTENGIHQYKVHPECKKYIESIATAKLKTISDDGTAKIVAGLNIVFLDVEAMYLGNLVKRKNIISGPSAALHHIQAISLSKDKTRIAVLHSVPKGWGDLPTTGTKKVDHLEREIKIYDATKSGNIAPLYILRDKDINKASALTFNPSGSELLVVNGSNNHIVKYSAQTDYRRRGHKQRKRNEKLVKIKPSEKTYREPSSIDFMNDGSLLIFDKQGEKVISLDPASNKVKWTLDKDSIDLNFVSHVHYNGKNKELVLSDDQGNQVSFKKD